MRIALVKRRYSLKVGGAERYCVNLARRLRSFGHDVTFIGESIDPELSSEVNFVPITVNRLTSWTKNRSFAENTGRAVRAGRFDVAYGLGRAFELDAVRITDRLQSHWLNVYYRNSVHRALQRLNPRHRTMIALERTIFHSSNVRRIVTQSRLDRELVVRYYRIPEEKVRTIYNGVDMNVFHPGVREERNQVREELGVEPTRPLLVFASMDFHGKGLRSLLRAVAIARSGRTLRLGGRRQRTDLAFSPNGRILGCRGIGAVRRASLRYPSLLWSSRSLADAHNIRAVPERQLGVPRVWHPRADDRHRRRSRPDRGRKDRLPRVERARDRGNRRADRCSFFAQRSRAGRDVERLLGDGPQNDGRKERPRNMRAVRRGAA